MTHSRLVIATVVLLLLSSATALRGSEKEPTPPDAARGQSLAQRLCVNCHNVNDPSDKITPRLDMVPSFSTLANRRDQSADRIRDVLIRPHFAMPNISLTREEIEDLVTFIDSLRKPSAGAPLLPPHKGRAKPVYPRPT